MTGKTFGCFEAHNNSMDGKAVTLYYRFLVTKCSFKISSVENVSVLYLNLQSISKDSACLNVCLVRFGTNENQSMSGRQCSLAPLTTALSGLHL